MVKRSAENRIRDLAGQFPVVIISGSRQAGKTTLIRTMYPDLPCYNLESPDVLARLREDPKGFLASLPEGRAVIDEAQHFPELASWIQPEVDEDTRPGRFFLTGSNQPLLRSQLRQSLAGRAAYFFLTPFTLKELGKKAPVAINEILFKGFYPPLYDRPFNPVDWHSQYVQTYLQRDLHQLEHIKNLRSFYRFMRLCAGNCGQILNMSRLARDADVSHTTVKHWLSILEASYIIFLIQPWHENYNKRLVKSPKLYFYDSGLAGHLAGITDMAQWDTHPLRGAFFENLVIAEIVKAGTLQKTPPEWFFWNSPGSIEIDLLVLHANTVKAYEIKSGATFKPEHVRNLTQWKTLSGRMDTALHLLYTGTDAFRHQDVEVMPWQQYLSGI